MKVSSCLSSSLSIILTLALGTSVSADQDQAPPAESAVRPLRFAQGVVVTPTRREEPMVRVPAPVTVISATEIERSTAHDIPELLRTHAGVQVADITGNRHSYRVDLRGFGETASSNTLVLVDGRRVTLPDLSGTDWLQIPLSRVDRIEVTRGSRGSVLYGDNATAGTINIITKDGASPERSVSVRAGSYSSFDVATSLHGARGDLSYAVDGGYRASDGYRANGDTEGGDLGFSLTARPNTRFNLTVSGGFHTDRTGLPGELKESALVAGASRRTTFKPDEFAEVDDIYVMAQPSVAFTNTTAAQLDLSFRRRDALFFSSFAGGTFDGDTTVETATISPKITTSAPVGGFPNTFVAGADFVRSSEDIVNTTVFGGAQTVGMFTLEKQNDGIYLHDELFPHTRLGVSGGYRYDQVEYVFAPSSSPSSTSFDQHLSTVGLNYNIAGDSYTYAAFSRSFRYPLLDELFNFFSNTIDATLRPQQSDSYEVGIRTAVNTVTGAINYFHVRSDDEIFFNPTGGAFGFGANENLDGQSRRHGVEVSAGGVHRDVRIGGTYTYTHGTILDGVFAGRALPNVARHRSTIEAAVQATERIVVSMDGTYVGARLFESDYPNVFGDQTSHVVVNLKLRYERGRTSTFLDVRNLLDRQYSEYGVLGGFPVERAFFPSPGINIRIGSSFRF